MKLKNLEGEILDRVEKVQRYFPLWISALVGVYEEYGLTHSFRRGSTSKALNRRVYDLVVYRNNRLRKEQRACDRQGKLRIRDYYSEVLVSLGAYLTYFKKL